MVTLPKVEIPGLREAVKREQYVRNRAFDCASELVCGVEVHPLTLRKFILLETAMNGMVVPCVFDDDEEAVAHAIQALYFCSPAFVAPKSPKQSFWSRFADGRRQHGFIVKVLRAQPDKRKVFEEIEAWLATAFMDAPKGGGDPDIPTTSHAAYPAYIIDLFAEAELPYTEDEIMDMPLAKLWQLWRLAAKRCRHIPLTSPSDELAVNHIAQIGGNR